MKTKNIVILGILIHASSVLLAGANPDGKIVNDDLILQPDCAIIAVGLNGSAYDRSYRPSYAIDGYIGSEYQNTGGAGTGFIVTPTYEDVVVNGLAITTSYYDEDTDPASYRIYGTNDEITSEDNSDGSTENWVLLSEGELNLPKERRATSDWVVFDNTTTYTSYKVLFPTLKGADADTMKITEIQFCGSKFLPFTEGLAYTYDAETLTSAVSGIGTATTKEIIIPGTVEYEGVVYTVTSIGENAFMRNGLRLVVIPDSVLTIEKQAFFDAIDLAHVDLGKGVTSIGDTAFQQCRSLQGIVIPDSVTTIEQSAFSRCESLVYAQLSSGLTAIGDSVFSKCALTNIVIPDSVLTIERSAFNSCNSLTDAQLGKGLTSIGYAAFSKCTSLTAITIPDNVQTIGEGAFSGCENLTDVQLGDGVKYIGWNAFGATRMSEITIPASVETMGGSVFNKNFDLIAVYFQGDCPDIEKYYGIPYSLYSGNNSQDLVSYYLEDYWESWNAKIVDGKWQDRPAVCASIKIIEQPQSQTINEDDPVTFSVVTTGIEPQYQWYKNGTAIEGANDKTYTIPAVKPEDAGAYMVKVWNFLDEKESEEAILTVIEKIRITEQPVSQTIHEDAAVTFSVTVTGTDPQYQWYKNGTAIEGADAAEYAIPTVKPADAATYTVKISNAANSVTSEGAVLTVIEKIRITKQPASQNINEDAAVTFSVTVTGTEPQYQWFKDGTAIEGASAAAYTIPAVKTEDEGTYSVTVSNAVNLVISEGAALTVNEKIRITTQPAAQTINEDDSVTFSVAVTGAEPQYQWFKDGTAIEGASAAAYTIPVVKSEDAGIYTVKISNSFSSAESVEAQLTVNEKPRIVTQPVSVKAFEEDTAVFSVQATGFGPLSYQWYQDGIAIAGANAETFAIQSVEPEDMGTYTVTVTNEIGKAESNEATLTVVPRITLISSPKSQEITYGESAVMEVVAEGADDIQYQWYWNGNAIEGANQPVYTIEKALVANTGNYYAELTSGIAVVRSETAVLTVNKAEQTIEFEPIGSVREGDVFTLSASTDQELPVRFVSSDETIVKIEGNIATAVGMGTVTITAIQDGNENYEAVSAEQTLVVKGDEPEITYELNVEEGTLTLKFTGKLYESEDGKTWTLVEGAKETYTVDIKQGKMKLYCAGK